MRAVGGQSRQITAGHKSRIYVGRPDDERFLTALTGKSELKPDEAKLIEDNILLISGSGLAGKSELLMWSFDAFNAKQNEDIIAAHGALEMAGELASETQHIDAWAKTLHSMRENLEQQAREKGLRAPRFRLFDAFYKRCVTPGSDADVPFHIGLKVLSGLAAALILASDILSQFSLQAWADALAEWIRPVIPGAELAIAILMYGALIAALVYNVIERFVPKLIVRFRDRVLRAYTYTRFGENPLSHPERLAKDDAETRPNAWPQEFNEKLLIKAFNADVEQWLQKLPDNNRVLLALDLQELPPASLPEARGRVRAAVDTLLGRATRSNDDAASPLLQSRAPIAVSSKFVMFGYPPKATSPLLSALARPQEVTFLSRDAAWDLVGKRIESWLDDEEIGNDALWQAMLAVRDLPRPSKAEEWSLKRGRNSTEAAERTGREFVNLTFAPGKTSDYHLLLIQTALAFGVLTASYALSGSGILQNEDFDQRLAGSIDLRLRHFLQVSGGILDEDFADPGAFRSRLIELTTAPKGTGETSSEIPSNAMEELKRALGYGPQGFEQGATLLAPFRFGLTEDDLARTGLDIRVGDLKQSPNIQFDSEDTGGPVRVILKEESRRVILHAKGHEDENLSRAYSRLRDAIEDNVTDFRRDTKDVAHHALSWTALACLTRTDDLESLAAIMEDIADRALTLGGYSDLTEPQNIELQHRLGEAAMRILVDAKFLQRGNAKRWNYDKNRPEDIGRLEATVQRYMRRFGYGQMDTPARNTFVTMLRKQGSYSPVVRDLARFLAEHGGTAAKGDWLDKIGLLHKENCREEALIRLTAIKPEPLAPENRLAYLRSLRRTADSLAGRCLPHAQSDPDFERLQSCVERAERQFLHPLFNAMQSGMADVPDHAGEIAFMALRTSVFWQQKLARFPVAQAVDQDGRSQFEALAAASRARQASILDFLSENQCDFTPTRVNDFIDVANLLGMDDRLKGERHTELNSWLKRARKAFFTSASRILESDTAANRIDADRFAQAAQALAVALSANWRAKGVFLSDDREVLWLSMVALRAAYCDFAARRFAARNGFDGFRLEDPDYLRARDRFVQTAYFEEYGPREARENMAARLLEAVAHATPDDLPDEPRLMLVTNRFGAATGAALGLDDNRPFLVCSSLVKPFAGVIQSGLAPARRWTKEFKMLPLAERLSAMEQVDGLPMLVNLLGSSGTMAHGLRRASGKGQEFVESVIETFLPLAPSGRDRTVKLGGSGSTAVLGLTRDQLDCFDAAGNVLAQLFTQLASLKRVILYEQEDRIPSQDPAKNHAELERDMARFLGRAMMMTWFIEGDRPSYGKEDDGDPGLASQQTIRKGESLPAFLARFSEESGTVNLLSLHPNPARPSHDAPTLRTVHSLFPKVFPGIHPEYEFDQVQAMLWPIKSTDLEA